MQLEHHQSLPLLLCLLTGCAQTISPAWQDGGDAVDGARDAVTADTVHPGDASAFCADPNSARMALNGVVAESPSPSASELFLNCCDSGAIRLITARFIDVISVVWRHQLGQGSGLPVTLDLANLPAGWSVSVLDGCDPTMATCTPVDRYDSGLTGTLRIERTAAGQLRMSTCLDASEPASMPHPVIHSLQLWVPPITAM
ncbi:MAG: hypothetical protein WCJ30_15840 [Deltaproteobacteria bacterium]